MFKLVLYEMKKLFSNKGICLLLGVLILLPPFLVPELDKHNRSDMVSDKSGNQVPYYVYLEQIDQDLGKYKGDLFDPKLSERIEKDYEIDLILQRVDPDKISQIYGKKLSYDELYEKVDELNETVFLEETDFPRRTYYNSVVHKLYNLKQKLSKENYQNEYAFIALNPVDKVRDAIARQKELNQQMEQLKSVPIDQVLSFEHLFSVLNIVSFSLSFFFLFLMPSIFNLECKDKMLRLLKTTSLGKRKVAIAKAITVVVLSTIIPLVSTLFSTLIIHLRYGLHNWNVSTMLIQDGYIFYNLFGYYIRRLVLMMLGCLGMSVIGTFLSSIIKSSYIALGIMIAYYVIWMFWAPGTGLIDWKTFTPMHILSDSGTTVLNSTSLFYRNHLYSQELILQVFWILISIFLLYLSYIAYQKRQITNES